MVKVIWSLDTGYLGCGYKGSFEVEDTATDEEITEMVRENAFDNINWGWSKVEDGEEVDEEYIQD